MKVEHNEKDSRFETVVEGGKAFVEYVRDGETMRFTHTEVPEAAEGKGVAGEVVRTALDYARSTNQRIVPICAYVKGFIKRHPEYADLVDAQP